MQCDRRTFLRAIGAGSIGVTASGLFSGSAAAATVITMEGAGADIWNEQDEFHYYYQQVSGDFDVVVHNLFIENTTGWAKCGIMARESLDADAKNVMLRRTPARDASVQWRPKKGAGSEMTDSSAWIQADWLRLKRKDDRIETYASRDGSNWTTLIPSGGRFSQSDIDLGEQIYLGLAVTSHVEDRLCTARFKDLSGDISLDGMTNRDIGGVEVAGSVSTEEGVPFVSTGEPTDVTATAATLHGTLDDLGQAKSAQAYFEYRETGADSWSASSKQMLSSPGSFSQEVTGLTKGIQEYEYRAIADTSDGDSAIGPIEKFITSSIVSVESITDVESTSATLDGSINLIDADSADVYFEYRTVPHAEWTATSAETLSSSGSFSQGISELTSRRYYQVRAVADTSDGITIASSVHLFDTPNPSNSKASPRGPSSTSHFEPGDGFAEVAPWLDDETPIIKVTEPTRAMLERSDVDGERLVVFETSGTIDLDGDLSIRNDKMYLAGQTAPSPGITLIRGGFYIDSNDCVVQHIRARAGDAGKQEESHWAPDSLHTGDGTKNNVIDHCTATWGVDETLSVGFNTANTTVSNCIVAEALWHPSSISGTRGKGSIAAGDGAESISWMGCIWANNVNRSPRLDGRTAIVNNIIYHVQEAANLDPEAFSSIVGNGFHDLVDEGVEGDPVINNGHVYHEDNYANPEVSVLVDVLEELNEPPLWPEGLEAMSSENVLEHNLENAGARPADRTPNDQRVIQDIKEGGGKWIDSQEEVGGYPDLEINSHTLHVPNGGTRAWIRSWSRRVETGAGQ